MKNQDPEREDDVDGSGPSKRSLLGLDFVNFFIADVETGVGPLLATYLSFAHKWNPADIGLVLGAQKLAGVLAQTPAGWLVDTFRKKTLLLVVAASLISLGCFFVVTARTFALQLANQVLVGFAVTLVTPAVAAISLGMLGKARFSARAGRNATFSHAGNLGMASLAGVLGYTLGQNWIFYVCALMGCFAIVSACSINGDDIHPEQARALEKQGAQPSAVLSLLQDRRILLFAVSVVLFHVANSAMLPLAGQQLSQMIHREASTYMSVAIVVSQIAMIPTSYVCGRLTDQIGRKPLFLFAFACLISRGLLFAFVRHPAAVLAIEVLDGLGTASSGVLTIVTASDLAKGTGRFNLIGGALQTCISLGALAGNVAAGYVAKNAGYASAFVSLACIATLGAGLYMGFVPETRAAIENNPAK